MPAFLSIMSWAASCHVLPSGAGSKYGSSSAHFWNTALVLASVHFSLPAIRPTWKS